MLNGVNCVAQARQVKAHVYQNAGLTMALIAGLLLPKGAFPEIAGLTIGSSVAGFDSRVPKLFHLPTNFGTIAYLILTYSD